ncbi:MAG: succinate dehydrogenase, cytochrome b556 subunit [Alphaproteobacteria bacterium]|nr:succinate dehydrogenase, cytochrome b556 subunit [Alphaproteobacteria bacterium]
MLKPPKSTAQPLSPHLTIYRIQLTSLFSIFHRLSGIFLSVGSLIFVYWIWSLAAGAQSYIQMQSIFQLWIVKLLLFFWTFAFFYHLVNGIRHLFWDFGKGYHLTHIYYSGYITLFLSIVITCLMWGHILKYF